MAKIIDAVLEIISGIMLMLALFGIAIADSDCDFSLILIGISSLWFMALTVIANWPRKERRNEASGH